MRNDTFGFIGFGLIGGSIARAIRGMDSNHCLIAYDHHIDSTNQNLLQAKEDGVLDHITSDLSDLRQCKVIYLCAPVDQNIWYLGQLKPFLLEDTIVTDVGSVKGDIHRAVEQLGLESYFIGGHPMAGSEKTGYAASNSMLLENAYYILTPTKQVTQDKLMVLYQLIHQMNAIPVILDANEHDDITAAISHVPHLVASTLVNLIREHDDPQEKMRMLAAGGFKDITRIASSSPSLWESICLSNAKSIVTFLDAFIRSLTEVRDAITQGDGSTVFRSFDTANQYRSTIPNHNGLIEPIYDLYLDVRDETGAIATVAVMLASHNISIKNIGIIHNREFQQGVLRIETYHQEERTRALALLLENNYTVYERQ